MKNKFIDGMKKYPRERDGNAKVNTIVSLGIVILMFWGVLSFESLNPIWIIVAVAVAISILRPKKWTGKSRRLDDYGDSGSIWMFIDTGGCDHNDCGCG